MEMQFEFLVLGALAGMGARTVVGFDPWKLIGTLSVITLFVPLVGIAFHQNPQVAQTMASQHLEAFIVALPSLVIGEVAGVVAASIYGAFRHMR